MNEKKEKIAYRKNFWKIQKMATKNLPCDLKTFTYQLNFFQSNLWMELVYTSKLKLP